MKKKLLLLTWGLIIPICMSARLVLTSPTYSSQGKGVPTKTQAKQVNQAKPAATWIKVRDDEMATIYYNSNITTDKSGNHIVWVKAEFHDTEWQNYFARQIGSRIPVASTKTKAKYDQYYSYVMVRQVICYNKAGKQLYNSGEDSSAGWGPVNASDPVGIVGELLGDKLRYDETYGY